MQAFPDAWGPNCPFERMDDQEMAAIRTKCDLNALHGVTVNTVGRLTVCFASRAHAGPLLSSCEDDVPDGG